MTPARGFLTPPPKWRSPATEKDQKWPTHAQSAKAGLFHVIHKVPSGDSPYVRAKHVQVSAFSSFFLFLNLHCISTIISCYFFLGFQYSSIAIGLQDHIMEVC